MTVACTSSLLEHFEKVDRFFVKMLFSRALREKSKSHRIVRIRYRKSLAFPKNTLSRRHKRFGKHHWSHRQDPQHRLSVIQGFGISRQIAGVIALKVVGSLSISGQPFNEAENSFQGFFCL